MRCAILDKRLHIWDHDFITHDINDTFSTAIIQPKQNKCDMNKYIRN